MLLPGCVRRLLCDAREEDDKHLLDALLVKETFWHLNCLAHKSANLVNEFRVFPVLEPFLAVTLFELFAEDGPESSQDWLVECVDLDRLSFVLDQR